jgi:hypothetical protein
MEGTTTASVPEVTESSSTVTMRLLKIWMITKTFKNVIWKSMFGVKKMQNFPLVA